MILIDHWSLMVRIGTDLYNDHRPIRRAVSTVGNEKGWYQESDFYFEERNSDFLFVHLDHVDHAGHHDGHKTETYYQAVSVADSLIGNIIQATKDAGIYEETAFIVSADHGGETIDEIEIPFIVYGKGVKKNHLIREKLYTYDNCGYRSFYAGDSATLRLDWQTGKKCI